MVAQKWKKIVGRIFFSFLNAYSQSWSQLSWFSKLYGRLLVNLKTGL